MEKGIILSNIESARKSFNILFKRVSPNGALELSSSSRFLFLLDSLFTVMENELKNGVPVTKENTVSTADILNEFAALAVKEPFRQTFDALLFQALSEKMENLSPRDLKNDDSDAAFLHRCALRMAFAFEILIPTYCKLIADTAEEDTMCIIRPSVQKTLHTKDSIFLQIGNTALAMELNKHSYAHKSFKDGRVYRYLNGEFRSVVLKGIRAVDEFYGYHAARKTFLEHFKAFSEGQSNLPLLITSLPGLGKTQMTISHSVFYENIILIIAQPDDLAEGLESLIQKLSQFPDKKFMIFFDDIECNTANWYYFRANIGGTFSLPAHIAIAISSNQHFPANVSSRGRGFVFPMFDEIRCQEMVADFLCSKGMKNPPSELISVIASDYVEEFGQKKFEELSPRTLVRYLDFYHKDAQKRRRILELSHGDVIFRPDPQVFYEENVKLLCSIYGDSALDELKKRELGNEK